MLLRTSDSCGVGGLGVLGAGLQGQSGSAEESQNEIAKTRSVSHTAHATYGGPPSYT